MKIKKILSFLLLCCTSYICAQEPDWVHRQLPTPTNDTYFYQVIAIDNAQSLSQAQELAKQQAMDYGIKYKKNWVNVQSLQSTEDELRIAINLACPPYIEDSNGKTIYYFLYQISKGTSIPQFEICDCGSTKLKDIREQQEKDLRTRAIRQIQKRAIPASVFVPGVGQMVKGQYLKGGLVLGGEVVGIAGIITSFSMVSSYDRLIQQDPKHAVQYADFADSWQNVGYGFIGLAAAVYIYNLIDVIVVRPSDSAINKQLENLTFLPQFDINNQSIALAIQWNF